MNDLSKQLGALSPKKQELLKLLLEEKQQAASKPAAQRIPRRQASDRVPLSFAQQRLWFIDQLEPGNVSYNIPAAVRLTGVLDVEVLERSLNEIVRRHEALRTTFAMVDGQPSQVIAPELRLALERKDLRHLPPEERERSVHRLTTEEVQKPFDLARGPLLRLVLLQLAPEEHVALLIIHHIVGDVWSIRVLIRELGVIYQAYAKGAPSPLPELPLQYADFAVWQQGWLRGEVLERQVDYWRGQLAGAPPALELPTDYPRPPVQSIWGAKHYVHIPRQQTDALKELAKREGVSLFMTLLAAYNILLYRYSSQPDIVVGTPIANRTRSELEGLIGFLINSLVLRTSLKGNPTFRELLSRVRDVTLGAFAHQDLPFEQLVTALKPERDMSRNPLYQVYFILQNLPSATLETSGLTLRPMAVETGTSQVDLSLDLAERPEGMTGWFDYDTDLFSAATIERMTGHFYALLEQILARPEARLDELSLLSPQEERQLLLDWNATTRAYPQERCIQQLFEEQVARTPDAPAVSCAGQTLSYAELNRRANQLAHHLRAHGVGPEVPVAISLERSPELVVGVLGILKAGGAYVPLDPAYPQERLAWIMQDVQAPVLLTQQHLLETLPAHQAAVICLDRDQAAIAQAESGDPPCRTGGDNLAYIIYTSGSTGVPKGAAVAHRNVVRLVKETGYASFGPDEVFLQLAPIAFDASTFELWGSLLNGARLAICPAQTPSLEELGRIITSEGITTLWLTAGLFHQMVEQQLEALLGLRQLLAGGDVLSASHVRRLLDAASGLRLINGYGPTESTTFTCCHPMTSAEQVGHSVSIGRPIANTQVYILDRALRPVPVGVYGELYIGGDGLARGYQSRPALTAERFVPNPFGGTPGARLYRTGDLVRYLPDGSVQFAGRLDHQVKVRGFRIELGEIEAALSAHPQLRESVVIAREDQPGDKRLVAYLVPQGDEPPGVGELRAFLKRTLPDHMIPSAFIALAELPLTTNGKVDRRALPAPEGERPTLEASFVAPRTATEQQLAQIWADLLGVRQVGVHDNFFELGGHSLLATQMVSRMREVFQVELPLRSLFEAPTVAGLSGEVELEQARSSGQLRLAPPILPVDRSAQLPLSFAQERLWFIDQLAPGSSAYNIPGAVRLRGALDVPALERTFNELVRRHEVFRTTFKVVSGRPLQEIAPVQPFQLPVIDLRAAPPREREAAALELASAEAQRPFDLANGPLLRLHLLRLDDDDHLLVLVTHHIIYDMWAREIFIREIGIIYEAYVNGQPSPLLELETQYADYAYWQRQWLQGEVLEGQLGYWKRQLEGAPAFLDLPTDHPRQQNATFRAQRQYLQLSPELTAQLKALSQREGVTLNMTMLAAFKILLYRYTHQEDILVGAPIAGRNRVDIEGLIGLFVNTLVLRTRLGDRPSFRALLGRVREATLEAYAQQDLPFELLVAELRPERDLTRHPLFQVMFNFLPTYSAPSYKLPNLTLSLQPLHSGGTEFDFDLDMWETDQGLRGAFDYSAELFEDQTITRMLGHFETLLEGIVADPDQGIAQLPLLPRVERRQLLQAWNETAVAYDLETCFPQVFEAQVARSPEAIAVICGQEALSYAELNQRANRLARQLVAGGVGPDTIVPLLAERGAHLLTAILAVFKAGGAYLPLDPRHPPQRIAGLIEQSGSSVIVTTSAFVPLLAAAAPSSAERAPDVLLVEQAVAQGAAEDDNLPARSGAANLAYVLFTSGSTGKPKGVMIEHAGMLNHLYVMNDVLGLGGDDRIAQTAPQSFDISVWQFLSVLLVGGSVHIVDDDVVRDPRQLLRQIVEQRLSVLEPVPSLLQALVEQLARDQVPAEALGALRWVIPTGETLQPELCRRWLTLYPSIPLLNAYGPAECADDVTLHPILTPPAEETLHMPIGKPVANMRVYLLDQAMQPVPIGVAGELYIGGVGVGRGYLGDEQRTAEVFLDDPFHERPGARMYKTGDLGRYLPDGSVEFLGRADYQVKIRGFRIELEEIEAVLSQHPAVVQNAVTVHDDGRGGKRLVAYAVCDGGEQAGSAELRAFLKAHLPEYMVPATLLLLPELPLTAHGKVDRNALPVPEEAWAEQERVVVEPRTPTERRLAEIWREVLGVERIGVEDDVFELGAHSLMAAQVIARLQDAFEVQVPVRMLFERPTIASLAESIDVLCWTVSSGAALVGSGLDDEDEGEL